MRTTRRLSAEERETIILFNEADATAEVEAYGTALRKQLRALSHENPQEVSCTRRGEESDRCTFPKRWLRIVAPRKATGRQCKHLADARNRITT
jgi:hypothetical protein